jgi:hypothetical protein
VYIHAERLLAKAGVASARGGGSPTLGTMRSGSGKGGAKRRAAQAQRGRLGIPLAGAGGGAPLRSFCRCGSDLAGCFGNQILYYSFYDAYEDFDDFAAKKVTRNALN